MEDRWKFRAWDPRDKEWRTDFTIEPESGTICDQYGCSGGRDELIICQCTGLKDKNQKLIFEGDIVQNQGGLHGPVIWDSNEGRYGVDSKKLIGWTWGGSDTWEVVGNLHEHPELLEKK